MIAVDANILIYAHRTDSPFHRVAATRLAELAEGNAPWALPWPCVHEFLAIVTNMRVYRPPTPIDAALAYIDALLSSPTVTLLSETEKHWQTLRSVISAGKIGGGRVHDARIAALCLEHGVHQLWSADRDFSRFPTVAAVNPLLT